MPHVLIVEDEPDLARLWGEVLTMSGHTFTHADSLEATQTKLSEAYDVCLVDWNLPDARGDAVVRAIVSAQPGTRIVITSGGGVDLPNDIAGAVQVVLQKPFGLTVLRKVIDG